MFGTITKKQTYYVTTDRKNRQKQQKISKKTSNFEGGGNKARPEDKSDSGLITSYKGGI